VRKFLGVDISPLGMDEAHRKIKEAEAIREMEVNVFAEAIAKVFSP